MEDAPVAPKILGVGEQVPLMLRHGYGNTALHGFVIALALVAVMVGVKNPVHLTDPHVAQVVEDFARSEVDQHTIRAVAEYVDRTSVVEAIQVFRQSLGPARG